MLNNKKPFMKSLQDKEFGGSSLIMIIMLIPAMFLLFGLGVDSSRATYARNTLVNHVESATIVATSQIDGISYRINEEKAKEAFIRSFGVSAADNGVLGCDPEGEGKGVIRKSSDTVYTTKTNDGITCKWVLVDFKVDNSTANGAVPSVTATVRGYSHNVFLRQQPIDHRNFVFEVTHTAYLKNSSV